MSAPPMNTLPSSAYSSPSAPEAEAAMVVSKPWCESAGSVPIFMSMKHPVPKVDFASPGAKQHWPKSAAC